jgi:hypothetical protein
MPVSWRKGENSPLPGDRLRVTLSTPLAVDLYALLLGLALGIVLLVLSRRARR